MPRSKKPRLLDAADNHVGSGGSEIVGAATADDLSVAIKAMIFGYFSTVDIMHLRCVCKKWREAAKKTIVPYSSQSNFYVDSVNKYNGMRVMTTALPNLQQLSILYLEDWGHKYSDGEDPHEAEARSTARWNTHDIEIISSFRKLRSLAIFQANMNGSYPFLFNFPLLRRLSIDLCDYVEWDLTMLAELPLLEELSTTDSQSLSGNINSLRVLKDTLKEVNINNCLGVRGNFMDLADFPHLKELHLPNTAVRGDVRDIGENDFPKLEELSLPSSVGGGIDYEFQHISDVPDVMHGIYRLMERGLSSYDDHDWWRLSDESPDWYDVDINDELMLTPPFKISFFKAGARLGWSWYGHVEHGTMKGLSSCEINWLDPEPDRKSSDYELYEQNLRNLKQSINVYRGYHQPPTEEEYNRICREYY